jgi:hypothetical protein
MRHTLPNALPSDWLAAVALPDSDGCYRGYKVIRPSGSNYHPFVIHTAVWMDDCEEPKWSYQNGTYCKTQEEALAEFGKMYLAAY